VISFTQLAIVSALALAAPLIVQLRPGLRIPSAVAEIALGVALGPSGLGWVHLDSPVQVLSDLGLAMLLFLAGLEIDVRALRPYARRLFGGYALSVALAVVVALLIGQVEDLDSPVFVGFALASSTVGLTVPILRDAGVTTTRFGQAVLAGASVGEFGAILLPRVRRFLEHLCSALTEATGNSPAGRQSVDATVNRMTRPQLQGLIAVSENLSSDAAARSLGISQPSLHRSARELERELRRKDAALAETAALLVLRKKAEALWGKDEDE